MIRRKNTRELVAGSWRDRFVFRVLVSGLVVFALVASFIIAGVPLYVLPRIDSPSRADAALVLGPPIVQRLVTAQELVDAGTVDTIVISVPEGIAEEGRHSRLKALCAGETDYTVICETPDPFTTQGEARLASDLMAENGWDTIIVVTSVSHITRARLLFDRCLPRTGGVALFIADGRAYDPQRWVSEYLYQTGAMVKALIRPSC